jgi:hypothetical protein
VHVSGSFFIITVASRELVARGLYGFSFQLNSKLKAETMPPTSYANATSRELRSFIWYEKNDIYSTSSITVLNITNFSSNFC